MKKIVFSVFWLIYCLTGYAQNQVISQEAISDNNNYILAGKTDLHLTDAENPIRNSQVHINFPDAWLFFDHMKPEEVVEKYQDVIFINGEKMNADVNCRVSMYAHGTVILSHTEDFPALEAFSKKNFEGEKETYSLHTYYTNSPAATIVISDEEAESIQRLPIMPLELDNAIRSFKLKRGYMATFANNPDASGYSRVFIADKEDILLPELPVELDSLISFIRVFRWEWPAKKGWAGGTRFHMEATNCTWYYTWGAGEESRTGMEFVPIRQTNVWPDFRTSINNIKRATHLLGHNEPDHWEQSNVSVDAAVDAWPYMLESGLRVGSPATTDFNWLYEFMEKCEARNYRVDYVVIHAYWGDPAHVWYNRMVEVYNRTKRPIWIKEWSYGAQWTGEWWPETERTNGGENYGPASLANQEHMRNNLREILHVMDTCSFIERYSIFNWVGNNRKLVMREGEDKSSVDLEGPENILTLAGELYRDDVTRLAYDDKFEVIPSWKMLTPSLTSGYDAVTNQITLNWNDPNGKLTKKLVIERKVNKNTYETVATITDASVTSWTDTPDSSIPGRVSYRIKIEGYEGTTINSNETDVYYTPDTGEIKFDKTFIPSTGWKTFSFGTPYTVPPMVIVGTPSYFGKTPMTTWVKNITGNKFEFQFTPWSYITNTSAIREENISYLVLPTGNYDFSGIKAEAGQVTNVSNQWKQYTFSVPFDEIPVIIPTQTTIKTTYPQTPRVRNVTRNGFEIMLQREEIKENESSMRENVSFLALTPGTGVINGTKIIAGLSPDYAAGNTSNTYRFEFGEEIANPALYAYMQTTHDDITSSLRYTELDRSGASVFKHRESSASTNFVEKEQVGWMVIALQDSPSGIREIRSGEVSVYPNPVSDVLYFEGFDAPVPVEVFNQLGQKVLAGKELNAIEVTLLPAGYYFLRIDKKIIKTFIKK